MTLSADTTTTPLTGSRLDDLMDRLEADLEASASSRTSDLAERLRAQPLRADSLDAIDRLHTLWMRAGDPAAARATIDVDGASVLDAAPPAAHADIRMHLALYRLQIAHHLREADAIRHAIAAMRDIVDTSPGLDAERYLWLHLLDTLERDCPDHALDTIELRHALHRAIPARAARRAADDADHACRRASALRRVGCDDDAREAADAAAVALLTAGDDQDVDEYDWLHVGDAVMDIAPHRLVTIRQSVEPRIADWPLAPRREAQVRLARLDARAAYALGYLHSALAQCEFARHSLDSAGADDFIEYELPWLIEAGCFDDAGRRAFFHLYQRESDLDDRVARTIHAQLAEPSDTSVWWPLCAMRACSDEMTFDRFVACGAADRQALAARSPMHAEIFAALDAFEGDALMFAVSDAARAVAERRAPDHPWTRRLAAAFDERVGRIDAATAAQRLIEAVRDGEIGDHRSANALFDARMKALGVEAVLKLPPMPLSSGMACYRFACGIEDRAAEAIARLPDAEEREARADLTRLRQIVYEQGRTQMEHFFETGEGHPHDACVHLYSMLCHDLAIIYREQARYQDAIDLHERGIAASPFAGHYDGLLRVRICMNDDEGTVAAAERLWHFSDEYVGEHGAPWYVEDLVRALSRLERGHELPIWLERVAARDEPSSSAAAAPAQQR
ncbi:hypothetical protein [Burkholderia guangdongensis]|uniref:hypothetical protein n=1 Tax=Burkholderia guangdongensis TaxID=1792500 RepID=UPI0015CEB33D|nr:hypothetical protein [Burkholderia guangdongensis]